MIKSLAVLTSLVAVSCSTPFERSLSQYEKTFTKAGIPGAYMSSINLKTDEEITYAFGYDQSGDQIFRLASMTKIITSVAALQLVDRGLITLDEPLEPILPVLAETKLLATECELETPSAPVTLRHLLSHTSGFGYGFVSKRHATCGLEMSWNPETPRLFESGENFIYGTGVGWAGLLIEEVSGIKLEQYIRENISAPLGMDRTWFNVPEVLQSEIQDYGHFAIKETESGYGETFEPFPSRIPTAPSIQYGGGSLFSSPNDYKRFLIMLVNGGEVDGVRVLSTTLVEEMFQNQLPKGVTRNLACINPRFCFASSLGPSDDLFGLGIALVSNSDGSAAKKGYWGGIYNTYFTVDYEQKIVVVYFSQYLPYADPRAYGLFQEFEREVYGKRG